LENPAHVYVPLKVLDDSGLLMLEQGRVSLNIESLLLS
jgi:hypothetical protein